MVDLTGPTPLRTTDSLVPEAINCLELLSWGGGSQILPIPCWSEGWLTVVQVGASSHSCWGLMSTIQSYPEDAVLLHPSLTSGYFNLSVSSDGPWALPNSDGALHSHTFSVPGPAVSFYTDHHPLCWLLWLGLRATLMYGKENLEDSLLLCPFSKIIGAGSLLVRSLIIF